MKITEAMKDILLAQIVDNLGNKCVHCKHVYDSITELRIRNPIAVIVSDDSFSMGLACEKCWQEKEKIK